MDETQRAGRATEQDSGRGIDQQTNRSEPGRGAETRAGGPRIGEGDLKQQASQIVQQGKEAAREVAGQVGQQAAQVTREVRDSVSTLAERGRQTASVQVGAFAHALHNAGSSLEQDQPTVARLTHDVAHRLDDACNYISNRDPRAMFDDLQNVARRNPELFIGGCVLLGILGARFLKASARRDHTHGRSMDDYGHYARGTSRPIEESEPMGPLASAGMGLPAPTPVDVRPEPPGSPPRMGGPF
jgi:hypothetical protein